MHTRLEHFLRQDALDFSHTVLDHNDSHVWINTRLEDNGNIGTTATGGRGTDIVDTVYTINRFLNRHDDTLLHGIGTGTRIVGTHLDDRGRNIRELLNWEVYKSYIAHQHDHYGECYRQNRTIYEKLTFHSSLFILHSSLSP